MVIGSVDDSGVSVIPDGYVIDRVEVYFSKKHQNIINEAIKHIRDYERLIDSNYDGYREYENDRRNRYIIDNRKKMLDRLSVMYDVYARTRVILKKC